jgi:hypothetical protein
LPRRRRLATGSVSRANADITASAANADPQGPPAAIPRIVNFKIEESYNLTILRSGNSLKIISLREAFERYFSETNR